MDLEALRKGLANTLERTEFAGLGARYEGKVRDNYSLGDGRRVIIVTDRISAFDRVLTTIPYKGQVLNTLAGYWFEQTRALVPNHLLTVPDPNVSIVTECEPIAVEFVVRAYLTGVTSTSIWRHYEGGSRLFCGHSLPDGLRKNQPLPTPLLTPSTKAEKGAHDESVSREEVLSRGLLSEADFDAIAAYAMSLFQFGVQHCRKQGLILVDTKYEFGKAPDGTIMLIDEIHTPDSSRFWFGDSYASRLSQGQEPESFDKEYVRRWLVGQGYDGEGPVPTIPDEVRVEAASRYISAYERIRGEAFAPNTKPPHQRLNDALLCVRR